jgi:hypothetical protein
MIRTYEVTAQTPTGEKVEIAWTRSKAAAGRVVVSRLAAREAGAIKIKAIRLANYDNAPTDPHHGGKIWDEQ